MSKMSSKDKRRHKRRLVAENGPYCQLCAGYLAPGEMTLDHIVPRSDGGPNAGWNLRLACRACNHGRHHLR